MAEPRINPESAPAGLLRAQDYLMSEAYKTSGMSGRNPFSTDATAVLNMPESPDGEGLMVPIWAYKERKHELANLGIHPVPSHWFKDDFNGGRPVRPASSSARLVDGWMTRDYGIEVVLYTTMPSTYRQIQANEAKLALEQRGGRNAIGAEGKAFDDLMARNNVGSFVEERSNVTVSSVNETGQINRQKRPLVVSVP